MQQRSRASSISLELTCFEDRGMKTTPQRSLPHSSSTESVLTFTSNDIVDDVPSCTSPSQAESEEDHVNEDDMIIGVMGPTGAGKSSFIKTATGDIKTAKGEDVVVGHSLRSCTRTVQVFRCRHPDGKRDVVFVDTPGFDDTELDDSEILRTIAEWLEKTYRRNIKLTGILYLHRITDNRLSGTPLRNLDMFQKLCGDNALPNVILMTTMWDDVEDDKGPMREMQLQNKFWKTMLTLGSQTCRYYNTHDSAWDVINHFKVGSGRVLQIQDEIVNKGKKLKDTSAGRTLFSWLADFIESVKTTIRRLEARLRNYRPSGDEDDGADLISSQMSGARTRLVKAIDQQTRLDAGRSGAVASKFGNLANSIRSSSTPDLPIASVHGSRSRMDLRRRFSRAANAWVGNGTGTDIRESTPTVLPSAKRSASPTPALTDSTALTKISLPPTTEGSPKPPVSAIRNRSQISSMTLPPSPSESLGPRFATTPSKPSTSAHTINPTPLIPAELDRKGKILQGSITALRHARQLVTGSPVPGLQGVISLVLGIAETVSAMEDTENVLLSLAQHASNFVLGIVDQSKTGPISADMRDTIANFERDLEAIKALAEKMLKQNRGQRYICQAADAGIVQQCYNTMTMSCHLLGMRAAIINHQNINQLETRLATLVELVRLVPRVPAIRPEQHRSMSPARGKTI